MRAFIISTNYIISYSLVALLHMNSITYIGSYYKYTSFQLWKNLILEPYYTSIEESGMLTILYTVLRFYNKPFSAYFFTQWYEREKNARTGELI